MKILDKAIELNKISHAYLFEGRAAEMLAIAETFAAKLASAADTKVVTNALFGAKKETAALSVDTVREMISDVYVRPYSSERKLYIIPSADTLTVQAQNSLLKILEEPPAYAVIILIAENPNVFLPTILSRVTIVKPAQSPAAKDEYDTSLQSETHGYIEKLTNHSPADMYRFIEYLKKNKKDIKPIFGILRDYFRGKLLTDTRAAACLEAVIATEKWLSGNINFNAAIQHLGLKLWGEL